MSKGINKGKKERKEKGREKGREDSFQSTIDIWYMKVAYKLNITHIIKEIITHI